MKKNKINLAIVPFIVGTVFGISVFVFLSFTSAPVNPPSPVTAITAANANVLLKHYLTTAVTPAAPIKGFYLDLQQLDAMNRLVKENPALAGFRVYLGKTVSDSAVGIVVGVTSKGLDATSNSIYRTDSPRSGPCPTVCDNSSTITNN